MGRGRTGRMGASPRRDNRTALEEILRRQQAAAFCAETHVRSTRAPLVSCGPRAPYGHYNVSMKRTRQAKYRQVFIFRNGTKTGGGQRLEQS